MNNKESREYLVSNSKEHIASLDELKAIREIYTKEIYSPKLTKDLLYNLYNFLRDPIISDKKLFSEYDKACLLCAIEIIEEQEEWIETQNDAMNHLRFQLQKANEEIKQWKKILEHYS